MKKNESGYPREAKPKAPTSPGATDGRPKRNCTGELMDGGADAGSPMGAARDTRENAPRQIGGAGCNMAEGACGGGGYWMARSLRTSMLRARNSVCFTAPPMH